MPITTTDPKNEIKRLSEALAKVGVTLPDAVTTPAVRDRVNDPSDTEIGEAIRAAKDPLTDATVKRLMLARQIARGGFETHVRQTAWSEQRQALKDSLSAINDQIHAVFDTAARELEAVVPELMGYTNLDTLILASLPARVADPARRAVNAQHTLRAARDAWLKLWRSVGGQRSGRPEEDILTACDPSPAEWLEHASRRPQSLPAPGDVWTMARNGWPLSLAHDLRDAKARAEHIRTTIDRESEKRRLEKGRATSWGLYR